MFWEKTTHRVVCYSSLWMQMGRQRLPLAVSLRLGCMPWLGYVELCGNTELAYYRARDGPHKLIGVFLIIKLDVGDQFHRMGDARAKAIVG